MNEKTLATQLIAAVGLLEKVSSNRDLLSRLTLEERTRLLKAAGSVYCPDLSERRRLLKIKKRQQKSEKVTRDQKVLSETGIRVLRRKPIFTTPNLIPPLIETKDLSDTLNVLEPQNCYVCKTDYSNIHHFYDQLCPTCADLNFRKRTELADLKGRVALLTGGRVKIGYQAGIKLLRSGVHLIVTTRFPRDAAARYAEETDFAEWSHRLEVFGIDLRHTLSVEALCRHLINTHTRLDFIINNACQTVRRPPHFYQHMMKRENIALDQMPEKVRKVLGAYEGLRGTHLLTKGNAVPVAGLTHASELSQIPLLSDEIVAQENLFPEGEFDQDLQQVDLRDHNSWRLMMAEVSTVELLEVQLVNAIAPFILNARLKPLMLLSPERDKHIVNVSAVEGQFYRRFKTTRHPHTNMAKAALNMMTRTSATDYHNDGIHMNAVDTGWVTDEDPEQLAEKKILEHRFHPPLDIVDGAARIVDPIISGFNTGDHIWGKFLKNFVPTDW